VRHSHASVAVVSTLLSTPGEDHWGYQLQNATGLPSGVVYPIVHRMVREGWLWVEQESIEEAAGRRPRRYLRLSLEELPQMIRWLEQAAHDPRFRGRLGFGGEDR
jgi:PadR family transcriptional regulator, regulatory protein PadR